MNSVTWADLLTELGLGRELTVSSRDLSVVHPLICFAWSQLPECGERMRCRVNVYSQEPQCLRPVGVASLPLSEWGC